MEGEAEFKCPRTEDTCSKCNELIRDEVYLVMGRSGLARFMVEQACSDIDNWRFPTSQLDNEALDATCEERQESARATAEAMVRRYRPPGRNS